MERNEKKAADYVDSAVRSARKRKIKTAAILISLVVVLVAVWVICYSQGFDPRGLIQSRYPWPGLG